MSFPARLKSLREERGLTQEQLAADVGLARSTVGGWEAQSKEREPDFEVVAKLANYFSVSVDYLFGRTDRRVPADADMAKVSAAAERISLALADDPDLAQFWDHLRRRQNLKLLFKQVRDLNDDSIKRIMRVVRAIEAEETLKL